MSSVPASFWSGLPLGPGVKLLAHDPNGIAAFDKPEGILSHPNDRAGSARALLVAPYDLAAECYVLPAAGNARPAVRPGPPGPRVWLLNRLDAATSGAILVAATEALAAEVRAQFLRKSVQKVYAALVFGRPTARSQVWRDRLQVEKRGGVIRTTAGQGIPSECRMQLAGPGRAGSGVSLLRLEPKTGRSHQLRVQCAERELPIVGDQTYGDFARNREFARKTGYARLFLHSLETRFVYEFQGRQHSFRAVAPAPREFAEFA